jgi:hypothetical protein
MRIYIVCLAESGQPMRAMPVTAEVAYTVSSRCADFVRLTAEDSRSAIQQAMALAKEEIQGITDWALAFLPRRLSILFPRLRYARSNAGPPR